MQGVVLLLISALVFLGLYAFFKRELYFRRDEANKFFGLWRKAIDKEIANKHSQDDQDKLGHRERCKTVLTGRKEACNCGYKKEPSS